MMRPRFHAAVVSAMLLVSVNGATAAPPRTYAAAPLAAAVTTLNVVPGSGRADVVIGIQGDVDVMDFAMDGGKRVVADIKGATLGIRPRLYDMVQRAGIANVRFAQFMPEVVRVVVELDAVREYTAVRGDNEVRLSVQGPSGFAPWSAQRGTQGQQGQGQPPVVTDGATQGRAQQPRISVAFQDADIRDVVIQFADFSGKTIIVGPQVTGTVRVTIVDQPWNIALKKILDGYGLAAIEDSTGIITVDSYRNLAALAAVEPLTTRIIQVNYTKAEAMAATVRSLLGAGCGGAAGGAAGGAVAPDAGGAICSSRGSVGSDEKTNSVIVTETLAHLRNIEGYIKDLDVRTPQITIKAKIITVDRTGTEQLGLSYDLGTAGTFSNALLPRVGVIGDQRVNLTGDGFAGVANSQRQYKGSSSLTLISNIMLGGFNLTSFLDALSSVQLTDVQAEPSVTTIDNKQAELFSGSSIAYLLTPPIIPGQIQSVAPQIQRQDIGIRLRVTPHVTANRQVLLDVYAEQEVLQSVTVAGPSTHKRQSTNQILVSDGETAVISGLTQTQVARSNSGIPLLMDLPLIGRLFAHTEVTERKQDLMILITPHIVDEGEVVRGTKKP